MRRKVLSRVLTVSLVGILQLILLSLFLNALFETPAQAQTWVNNTGFASNRMIWNMPNAPLIGTPIVDWATPASPSPVGATSATPGLAAGASNATVVDLGVVSTAIMTSPVTLPVSVAGVPAVATVEGASAAPGGQTLAQARGPALDFGIGTFNNAYNFPSLNGRSLAEVAREIRQEVKQHPAHKVYTNDDIARLKQPTNTINR